MRLDIKINEFHHSLIQSVWFSVDCEATGRLYLNCSHVDGTDVVSIEFQSGIPTALCWASFKIQKSHITKKELENYILDWMLTDDGSYATKKAYEQLDKDYSEI